MTVLGCVVLRVASADVTATAVPDWSGLDPAMRQLVTPALSTWIASTRDAALVQGVAIIPPEIRAALEGHVPGEILDRVRWRVDDGLLSLQQGLFRFGYTPAMTLDHVILFADESDALSDPKLWAHELFHVMQYRDWGVAGFAERYVEDYAGVEREAAEFRWQFMRATGRIPPTTHW